MNREEMEKEFENNIQEVFNLTDEQMLLIKTHSKKQRNLIKMRINNTRKTGQIYTNIIIDELIEQNTE